MTLKPGESFSWSNLDQWGVFFPFRPTSFKITFDNIYTIDLSSFADDRNPLRKSNYEIEEEKNERPIATYIFTNQDYEIAKINS